MTVIGGADGPTSIFITSGMGWLNVSGLIVVVMLLLPNILYALRHKGEQNKCTNRLVNIAEQIGRYGCLFLMVFHIGVAELGFASVAAFLIYLVGNVLLLAYFAFWIVYAKRKSQFVALMLAILPTLLFLLSGLTMGHWLLVGFALLFGAAHIYITAVNAREAA